jgi:uncharacterized integral membrane protein
MAKVELHILPYVSLFNAPAKESIKENNRYKFLVSRILITILYSIIVYKNHAKCEIKIFTYNFNMLWIFEE